MKLPTMPAAEYRRLLAKDRVMAIGPRIVDSGWPMHVAERLGLNGVEMTAFMKSPPPNYEDLLIGVIDQTRDEETTAALHRAAELDDLIHDIEKSRQRLWSTTLGEPPGGEKAA